MYGGTSYYWRGAVTNNHVIFGKHNTNIPDVYYGFYSSSNNSFKEYDSLSACQNASSYNTNCTLISKAGKDMCWRIIRINGDGTLRIIYNGAIKDDGTCTGNSSNSGSIAVTNVQYNTSNSRSEYVGWTYVEGKQRPEEGDTVTESNAKIQTETWYNNNIGNNSSYASKVAEGKYCNDRRTGSRYGQVSSGKSHNYSGWERYDLTKMDLYCAPTDTYSLKVGLVTLDEARLSGPGTGSTLDVGIAHWTMTPSAYSSAASVSTVTTDGSGNAFDVSNSTPGIRPVINIQKNVKFSSGSGTTGSPYIIE